MLIIIQSKNTSTWCKNIFTVDLLLKNYLERRVGRGDEGRGSLFLEEDWYQQKKVAPSFHTGYSEADRKNYNDNDDDDAIMVVTIIVVG